MPNFFVISGIRIDLYFHDHSPPHFHARYGEKEALISIHDLKILKGNLPVSQTRTVLAWARGHQVELLEIWNHLQR